MEDLEDLKGDVDFSKVSVNLKTSNMKPINARWLITAHDHVAALPDLLISGVRKAGLCK